jgi:accessory gene regulator protein AgrB
VDQVLELRLRLRRRRRRRRRRRPVLLLLLLLAEIRAAALIPLNERWAIVGSSVVVVSLSPVKVPAGDEGAVSAR